MVKLEDGTWEYEHRVIAEKKIGRKLEPHEVVHHVDGDQLNNDEKNLAVVTRQKHMRLHLEAEKLGLQVIAYELSVMDRMYSGC